LYSIANFMRYERPQRGREREFWQLNADIFGVDTMLADAEIIEMADAMMKALGADESMYVIRINHRALIDQIMHEYLGLDKDRSHKLIKLLDRKAKMPAEDFAVAAREVLGNDELVVKVETLTTLQSIAELPEELQASRGARELKELFDWFDKAGMTNVTFDISLMRGFDYYTGMVFEMFDLHPDNNRSMFGGGRYDGLVGLFGVEPVATVGFAPGLTTTELFLRSHNLLPELHSSTDIGIVIADDSVAAALDVARQLRREGLAVSVDITGRKLDKQLKAAAKNGIRTLVFIGSQEVSENRYTVKDMITGDEQKLVVSDIVALAKIRHNT